MNTSANISANISKSTARDDVKNILDCRVDLCGLNQALDAANNALKSGNNFQIITINPEMIMAAQSDKAFFEIVNNSDLNIADGVGVKLALKLKGININQIRGVDFSRELIKLASENNYSVAFLGAKEEIIQKAKENFLNKYPNLNLVYVRNGYFDFENCEAKQEIYNELKQANPKILLVGLGSPKQEIIIKELKEILSGTVMVGVGGSFDVFSGVTKEAPKIVRKLNIEWLYRTTKEPKRLKRIFPVLPLFLIKCIMSK